MSVHPYLNQKLFIIDIKFEFKWMPYILSGNPTTEYL